MLFGCYPKEMALNQEDWHKILVALSNGDEKKIFKVLYEKKVIDDKSPKLRTEDEKKMLKSLSYQMSKFPQKLIEGIQEKFPFLQGTPKTGEQRKEQKKEGNRQKRAAESQKETEMRLNKQKKYNHEKRLAESQKEKEMRQEQDKEFHRQKRSAESEKEKERRLNKQKKYEHKRFRESTEFRAKKVKEVREKPFGRE